MLQVQHQFVPQRQQKPILIQKFKKKNDNRIMKYDKRTMTPTCVEGNHGIFFFLTPELISVEKLNF